MNPVPVFAFPSAHGIEFIFGSEGQEGAKFKFARVSAEFVGLFSHVPRPSATTRASELTVRQTPPING